MDTEMSPSVKAKRDLRGLPAVLASAFREWLLIFLLFVNAVFSYVLTKFARKSKLQTPCLLCSRLDHVIGNEEPGFYKNIICSAHKLELSSLGYCHIHDKLAQVHEMCEDCLFSFATDKKSNPETYKFLVGKLGTDFESYFCRDPSLEQSSCEKQCSCCNETWTPSSYDQRLLKRESIHSESSEGRNRLDHSDGLKKRNKKKSGQLTTSYLRSRSFEALSHIGYSELKITSETESEIIFSDEDDGSTMAQDGDDFKDEFVTPYDQPELGITTPPTLLKNLDDLAPDKLSSLAASSVLPVRVPTKKIALDHGLARKKQIPRASSPLPVPTPHEQIIVGEPKTLTPPAATEAFYHGLAADKLLSGDSSPGLPVRVTNEQIEVEETGYLTPPISTVASCDGLATEKEVTEASTSLLSFLVPNEQGDRDDPDYLTPPTSNVASDSGSHPVLEKQTSQAFSPLLSVLVPNEQVDGDETGYLTPPTSMVAAGSGSVVENQISRSFSPPLAVLDPNEQIDVGETDDLTPLMSPVELGHDLATEKPSPKASSPALSVLIPNKQIDIGEPDYLTPSTSTVAASDRLAPEIPVSEASSPALTIQLPIKKIDVGEPDYLTPLADIDSFGHMLAPEKSTSQASSPRLPVLVPNEQIDERNFFTPTASTDDKHHGLASDMQISEASLPILSVLVPNEQIQVGDLDYLTPLASADALGHGLKELNWHQVNPPAPPELVSVDATPFSFRTKEVFVGAPGKPDITKTGDLDQTVTTESVKNSKIESDSLTTTESCLETDLAVKVSEEILDAAEIGENGKTMATESQEVLESQRENGSKTDQESNDGDAPFRNSSDLADCLKVVVDKGSQVSNILAEQLAMKDSTRVNEDLKLLLSQAARGIDSSSNEMSPRAHFHGDGVKTSDASSSKEMPKRASVERSEFDVESSDGSIMSEIEGESAVDRLKRQEEHEWRSVSALYKELEEERNASAIAANQAMAMITRLQEEKAALHMEALQYLRMMEEQAEYDVEALQKANDLLAEREKEMQDLEAELEFYRRKYPDESMIDEIQGSWCHMNGGDVEIEHSDLSSTIAPNNSIVSREPKNEQKSETISTINDDTLSNFEEEKLYISKCLMKLEKQLQLLSKNGIYYSSSNGGYTGKECHLENGTMREHKFSTQNDSNPNQEGHSSEDEKCSSPMGNHQLQKKEYHHSDSDEQEKATDKGEVLVALENEVSDLNERLEALEENRSFLEHTINALRNGDEGMQFVQEIALHLRELRRIGMKSI